jgi:hypothetical protein
VRWRAGAGIERLRRRRDVEGLLALVGDEQLPAGTAAAALGVLDRLDSDGTTVSPDRVLHALVRRRRRSPSGAPDDPADRAALLGPAGSLLSRRARGDLVPELIELLQDDDPFLRALAAPVLAALTRNPVLERYPGGLAPTAGRLGPLASRAFDVRAFTALGGAIDRSLDDLLGTTTDEETLHFLAAVVAARRAPLPVTERARLAAVRGGWRTAADLGSDAARGVVELLRHPSRDVQLSALLTLREAPTTAAVEALSACARDAANWYRVDAVRALAATPGAPSAGRLLELCGPEWPVPVRRAALAGLTERGDRRVLQPLVAALSWAEPDDRRYVLLLLGRLRTQEATDVLLDLLEREHGSGAVVHALGLTGDRRAADALLPYLPSASAALALADLGARDAVPAICRMLQPDPADEYAHARRAAAEALGRLGDPAALPALQSVWVQPAGPDFNSGDDDWILARQQSAEAVDAAIRALGGTPGGPR